MTDLTDLEAVTIGFVDRQKECTAYAIRRCFRDSPTSRFSDSAGSVYPMVRRLEKEGLLDSERRKEGRRFVRYYRATAAGLAALKSWLGPPLDDRDALSVDPLRTKIIYLWHLPPRKRSHWLEKAMELLQEKLKQIEARIATRQVADLDEPEIFYAMADENARMELQTRLRWLRKISARLNKVP